METQSQLTEKHTECKEAGKGRRIIVLWYSTVSSVVSVVLIENISEFVESPFRGRPGGHHHKQSGR